MLSEKKSSRKMHTTSSANFFRKNDVFNVLVKVIVRRQYPIRIPKTAKLEYDDCCSQYLIKIIVLKPYL